ncbi:MAG: tripartite tricarboxylate transporter substrate binding protein [Proteobacteria bacterium]|nr:tripartite tricarboxylate transporter substrate binding protein [Burkholderiales bacterium]
MSRSAFSRRVLVATSLSLVVLWPAVAHAQTDPAKRDAYPSRPVRFIVPFAPGAANDLIARAVGSKLSELWSQSVVVDNRPGGGTVIGSELVARAPADGYTLLQIGLAHAVNPSVIAKLPYDSLRDFTAIAQTGESPFVMVSNAALPARNLKELVAMARAKPGTLAYGSTGSGGTSHLMGELLKSKAGIDVIHVPYKGLAPALTDVIGGQIQYSFGSWSTVGPFVKAGKLRALAVTSAKRSATTPDLPTIAEEGFAGYDATPWWGIAGPGGMARPLVGRIHGDIQRALVSSELKERFAQQGIDIVRSTPEQFLALIKAEIVRWAEIVKTSGIKAD